MQRDGQATTCFPCSKCRPDSSKRARDSSLHPGYWLRKTSQSMLRCEQSAVSCDPEGLMSIQGKLVWISHEVTTARTWAVMICALGAWQQALAAEPDVRL